MPGEFSKIGKFEFNPYRPDVPSSIQDLSPDLYYHLREVAETLRGQHNTRQAGDTTFSWEMLTEVDLESRYNRGSLGKFYHPIYGIIQARYCQFDDMIDSNWLGAPIGLNLSKSPVNWTVTNDFSKSAADAVIGVGGCWIIPPSGSFGWVIVDGVNIQKLALRADQPLAQLTSFAWVESEICAIQSLAAGNGVGFILNLGEFDAITVVDAVTLWEIPAGAAYVRVATDSEKRIRDWIASAIVPIQQALAELDSRIDVIEGAEGLGGIRESITALQAEVNANSIQIARESESRTVGLYVLEGRVVTLEESAASSAGPGAIVANLRSDVNALTSDFSTYSTMTNSALGVIRNQLSEALAVTTLVHPELTVIKNQIVGVADVVTELAGNIITKIGAATDNAIVRWDGVTGALVQDSLVTISDTGRITTTLPSASSTPALEIKVGAVTLFNFRDDAVFQWNPGGPGASFSWDTAKALIVLNSGVTDFDIKFSGWPRHYFTKDGLAFGLDDPYAVGWNGSLFVPTKNAIYDKLESYGINGPGILTYATDAGTTATYSTTKRTVTLTGTLTADRTMTLSTTGAVEGARFRFVRTGGGAFIWNIGAGTPLKTLAVNTWCEVEYSGSTWVLTAYGTL